MKKNNTELLILMSIIVIANFVLKGLLFTKYPNSLSPEEVINIKLLHLPLSGYINYYCLRLIPISLSFLISLLSFIIFYKVSNNLLLGFFVSLSLTISPWIFILSRFLNFYIFLLFIIVLIYFFFYQNKIKYILTLIFLIAFTYFMGIRVLSPDNLSSKIQLLMKIVDFKILFFNGDFTSSYIHIPKTGFFMYIDFFIFILGIYYLIFYANPKIRLLILDFLIIGLIWSFTTSTYSIATFSSIFILYALNLIIGLGYYFLLQQFFIKRKKHFVVTLFITTIILFNLIYYQELFYFHFNKKNSFEWGYAEETLTKYIEKNRTNIRDIYISPRSGKFADYFALFSKNISKYNVYKLQSNNELLPIKNKCLDKMTLCILDEGELERFMNIRRESITKKVVSFNGLTAYTLLSKNTLREK